MAAEGGKPNILGAFISACPHYDIYSSREFTGGDETFVFYYGTDKKDNSIPNENKIKLNKGKKSEET